MLMLLRLMFKSSTYHRDHPGWYLVYQGCHLGHGKYLKKNQHEPLFELQYAIAIRSD